MNVWDIYRGNCEEYFVDTAHPYMSAETATSTLDAKWHAPDTRETDGQAQATLNFHLTANVEFPRAWYRPQRVWFEMPEYSVFDHLDSNRDAGPCLVSFSRRIGRREHYRAVEAVYFIQTNDITWPASFAEVASELSIINSQLNDGVPLRLADAANYASGTVFLWLGTRVYGVAGGDCVPCMKTPRGTEIVNANSYPSRAPSAAQFDAWNKQANLEANIPIPPPLPPKLLDLDSPRVLRIRKY